MPSQTAYIDGLRGLLSLVVFNAHLTPVIILGYDKLSGLGQSTLERSVLDIPLVASGVRHWDLFTIPFVKLVYSASPAVSMFFAISGYVLSIKWIDHGERRTGNPLRALKTLGSTMFRRPLRLILISMASMVMPFLLCKMGYLDRTAVKRHGLTKLERGFRFWLEQWDFFPDRQSTWWLQARDLITNFGRLFIIFTQRTDKSFQVHYNPALWTIKVDLRASLALLATQIALFDIKRHWRIRLLIVLVILGWSVGSLECPLFWAGWTIAELHHPPNQASVKQHQEVAKSPRPTTRQGGTSIGKSVIFGLGCYVASYPTWKPSKASAFSILRAVTRGLEVAPRTWHSIGAILILYSLRDIPLARRLCEASISQFLGRHSFSIYLVHVWTVVCVGPDLFSWVWSITGHEDMLPFAIGFGVSYFILLGIVLLVSAVFRVFIELPLNRVVNDLYKSALLQ